MTMSSKRCRKPVPPVQGFPSLQLQHEKKKRFGRHRKSRKLMVGDKQTTCDRRWEDMDHEILIYIMKKYKWHEWGYVIDFVICKSWLSAFLDVLFPPGDVLDLRLLDDHANFGEAFLGKNSTYAMKIRKFLHYLKLNIDRRPPNYYTKLVLSECILHHKAYTVLAQRLPLLKSFVIPDKMSSYDPRLCSKSCTNPYYYVSLSMFRHLSNLEEVHCHYSMLWDLSICKTVRDLTLVGKPGCRELLQDSISVVIAENFPLLDRLVMSAYVFSFTGLSMILDSHKNLSYLDIRHTMLIPYQVPHLRWCYLIPQDYLWPKELSLKFASVRTSLTCDRKNCPDCIYLDSIAPKPIRTMSTKRWRPTPRTYLGFHPGKITWFQRHGKCDRRWEEMDHEILIYIMNKYKWYEWGYIDFVICKTWLSAFLDAMFPPGDVLDLRLLDDHENFGSTLFDDYSEYAWKIRKFLYYLKLNFDRRSPNHYTKLILSECMLPWKGYRDVAKRLPALKSVVSPAKLSSSDEKLYPNVRYHTISGVMFPYWKNLEDAHCHYTMLWDLALCCKSVRKLTLFGRHDTRDWHADNVASLIVQGFPLLDHLGIPAFVFSFKGISMILDDLKNLSYLDMRHTLLIPDEVMLWRQPFLVSLDYPWPKNLSHKIAGVRTCLTCDRKNCANCINFDSWFEKHYKY